MKINSRKKNKSLTSVTAALLAAAVIVGGGAWLNMQGSAESSELIISLSEPSGAECGYSYNVIPGRTDKKDPVVTLTNVTSAYVFVEVTDTVNKNGSIVKYSMADGWENITDNVTGKKPSGVTAVYSKKIAAGTNQQIQILKDNEVSYDIGLTNEDMMKITEGNNTIAFKAKAIESVPFSNAADAYNKFDVTQISVSISTKKSLNAQLNKSNPSQNPILCTLTADLGDGGLVSGDLASTSVSLNNKYKDITINGSGHSIAFAGTLSGKTTCIGYGEENQSLVLRNVTVTDSTGIGFFSSRTIVNMNCSWAALALENATVKTNRYAGGYDTNNAVLVGGDNSTLKISNSVITVASSEYAVTVTGSNAKVYIESGTITGKLSFEANTTVEITGGTFINSNLTYDKICSYVDLNKYDVNAYENASGGSAVNNPTSKKEYTRYVVTPK